MAEEKNTNKDISENNLLAAISYVWILCLVPLFLKRDSKFVQFHAKQGLVLFFIEIVGTLVFWIPLVGWLLFIAILILAILGFVNAIQGNSWKMPVVGDLAQKINL